METLAHLDLDRVADSVVGDVSRRGISGTKSFRRRSKVWTVVYMLSTLFLVGGERKRVNIGIELMAKPSILFLDEPTSGLDSSSAMIVMKALRNLVDRQGMTICSVIHQPRAFIYELFDSIILMGLGGRLVYQGPTREAYSYFTSLGYQLPMGESIADWILDISSGYIKRESGTGDDRSTMKTLRKLDHRAELATLFESWTKFFDNMSPDKKESPAPFRLPLSRMRPGFLKQVMFNIHRIFLSKLLVFSSVCNVVLCPLATSGLCHFLMEINSF
jgi:hypothetical protein